MMLADGVRPEDNIFSHAILWDRYPDDYPADPQDKEAQAMIAPDKQTEGGNLADRDALFRLLAEIDAQTGFVYDPMATPERSQELMRASGIRAEDNLFSRDILRERYPEDYGEDDK